VKNFGHSLCVFVGEAVPLPSVAAETKAASKAVAADFDRLQSVHYAPQSLAVLISPADSDQANEAREGAMKRKQRNSDGEADGKAEKRTRTGWLFDWRARMLCCAQMPLWMSLQSAFLTRDLEEFRRTQTTTNSWRLLLLTW
jgi:hypothetical protein